MCPSTSPTRVVRRPLAPRPGPEPCGGSRPRPLRRIAALALVLFPLAAAPLRAQTTPRPGEWFEEADELGFRVRLPKGWAFLPPEPGEVDLLGRADAGSSSQILAPGATRSLGWNYQLWIVRLDRREGARPAPVPPGKTPATRRARELDEWLKRSPPSGGPRGWKEDERARREDEVGGLTVTEREFWQTVGEKDTELRLFAAVFALEDRLELALVFNGPGGRNWSKHRNAARALARTLERVPVRTPAGPPNGASLREQRRAELKRELARSEGWMLTETPGFLIVAEVGDAELVREAGARLEAIGAVFRELFPPELPARLAAEEAGPPDPDSARETAVLPERAERRAAASVVRLCRSRERYQAYGGPPGTGGYWSAEALELVLFDDREVLGRDATWRALNHEAFHQYAHHYLDGAEPHTWFDEGHGDWFGGFALSRGQFVEQPNADRQRAARELLRAGRELPLREFVRLPRRRYYAEGPAGVDEAQRAAHYAQGWSLVRFLRTGEGRAPAFDPAWSGILGAYVEGLLRGRGAERALGQAFEGVDWEALERSWRAYTLE